MTRERDAIGMAGMIGLAMLGTGYFSPRSYEIIKDEFPEGDWVVPGPKRKAKPKPVATEPAKEWPETRQQRRYRERKGL